MNKEYTAEVEYSMQQQSNINTAVNESSYFLIPIQVSKQDVTCKVITMFHNFYIFFFCVCIKNLKKNIIWLSSQ